MIHSTFCMMAQVQITEMILVVVSSLIDVLSNLFMALLFPTTLHTPHSTPHST